MKKPEIEAKLTRVLGGGTNPLDLNDILQFMRYHSHGLMSVREVGDLLVHFDRRDRREILKHSAVLARLGRSLIDTILTNKIDPRVHGQSLIERVMSYGEREVRRATGLSRKRCMERMSAAIKDGNIDSERKLFEHFGRVHTLRPLLSGQQITEDLHHALQKAHLITSVEQSEQFQKVAPLFILHFITRAHLCELVLSKDYSGTIRAGTDNSTLQLLVEVNVTLPQGDFPLQMVLVQTSLTVADYVHPGSEPLGQVQTLSPHPPFVEPDRCAVWTLPLELVGGKIAVIGGG